MTTNGNLKSKGAPTFEDNEVGLNLRVLPLLDPKHKQLGPVLEVLHHMPPTIKFVPTHAL